MKRLTVCLLFALSIINCTNPKQNKDMNEEISQLKAEIENLNQRIAENPSGEGTKIATFLTFQKEDAEQAMNFYISLFENSKIIDIKRWGNEGMGKEGTIMHATFKLG